MKQPFKNSRNGGPELKKLTLLITFLWLVPATASDPGPSWGAGWQANVWNTYCELKRQYYIPYQSDPDKRGFLSGTAFNQAFVTFMARADTQLHSSFATPESVGVVYFHLYVYPESRPVADDQRIVEASIGGYTSEANVVSNAEIHIFSLSEDQSAQLLQRFIDNEVVEFELIFANGSAKPFKIYPSGDRTFYVLADMFRACIRSHKGKKR